MIVKPLTYTITLNEVVPKYKVSVRNSGSMPEELVREMFKDCLHSHEELHAVYLKNNLEIKFTERIGSGSLTCVVADIHKIITTMSIQRCQRLILMHNHPSGDRRPSPADISLTNKVRDALKLIDTQLVDHLIVVDNFEVVSMADKGLV